MTAHYNNGTVRKPAARTKPDKPHRDFPLTPHGNGQWCKKIRYKLHYFGPWDDPDAALERYLDTKDDLLAGRTPRNRDGLTVRQLVNRFLAVKESLVDTGEITKRHWQNYHDTCERIIKTFGRGRLVEDLRAEDFEKLRAVYAKGVGPETLGNDVQRTRSVFKYAWDADLIDRPVRFGPTFRRPSKRVRRKARKVQGPRMFEADEIRTLVRAARPQLKAMVLLGINCALGNTDVATLPRSRVDLRRGWHNYERPKTGVDRSCPLWKETAAALREVERTRPRPLDEENGGLMFITHHGKPWVRLCETSSNWIDSVGLEFGKLANAAGVKKKWIGFYSLRRTFRTIADRAGDQPAAMYIMGHADEDDDMSAIYRQRIDEDRLIKVSDYVRQWVFPETSADD